MDKQKICIQCGRELPVSCFYISRNNKSGLTPLCKECDNTKNKQWRDQHKERERLRKREWREKNREKERALNQKRRAKKKGNGGFFTDEQWNDCLMFFGERCAYSNEEFDNTNSNKVSIDHIIPLNNGGTSFIWNLVPACNKYNGSKNAANMEEWYKKQPFFLEERLQKIYEWQEYAYNKWGYLEYQIS